MKEERRTNLILWAVIAALVVTNAVTVVAFVWQTLQNQKLRQQIAGTRRMTPVAAAPALADARRVHDAAQKGDVERLKALLDEHPDLLNCRPYPSGSTPLHAAAFYGKDAAVKELVARKADTHALNKAGLTPLHDCVHRGTVESAAMLLDARADLSIRNNAGQTPLEYALAKNRPDMAELLRQRGAKE